MVSTNRRMPLFEEEIDVTHRTIILAVCEEDDMVISSDSPTVGHHLQVNKFGSYTKYVIANWGVSSREGSFAAQSNSPTFDNNFNKTKLMACGHYGLHQH